MVQSGRWIVVHSGRWNVVQDPTELFPYASNNRAYTVLLYLSDTEEGGGTIFPVAKPPLEVKQHFSDFELSTLYHFTYLGYPSGLPVSALCLL